MVAVCPQAILCPAWNPSWIQHGGKQWQPEAGHEGGETATTTAPSTITAEA